jgi:hypothetical protein
LATPHKLDSSGHGAPVERVSLACESGCVTGLLAWLPLPGWPGFAEFCSFIGFDEVTELDERFRS